MITMNNLGTTVMRIWLIFAPAFILAFILSSQATSAAEITPEGAVQLKALFSERLEDQVQAFAQSESESRLITEGEVTVEPEDGYYAVTLPKLSIAYEDGHTLDIGFVAINAAPHDQPGMWKMTIALPTPMVMNNENGEAVARLSIGDQKIGALWAEALEGFSKLDGRLGNIAISNLENGGGASVANVHMFSNLDVDTDARWSGPGHFELTDINISGSSIEKEKEEEQAEAVPFTMTINKARIDFDIQRYDPTIMAGVRENMISTAQNGNPAEVVVAPVLGTLTQIMDGMSLRYTVGGVTMDGVTTDTGSSVKTTIGEARFAFALTGMLSDLMTFSAEMGVTDTAMTPAPEGLWSLAPSTTGLNMTVRNLPHKTLLNHAQERLQSASENGKDVNPAMMALSLPALLSEAGTVMEIKETRAKNDLYAVNINGQAKSDAEAVNKMTADIITKINGLEDVITFLQEKVASAPPAMAPMFGQAIMGLQMAKGFGKAEADDNGEILHVYHLVVNKEGHILLNGQNMSMLLGGMGGAIQTQPATP